MKLFHEAGSMEKWAGDPKLMNGSVHYRTRLLYIYYLAAGRAEWLLMQVISPKCFPGLEKTPVLPTSQPSSPSPSGSSHSQSPLTNFGPSATAASSTSTSTTIAQRDWHETFQVEWENMPLGVRSAISYGKRPAPADRRQMVRLLVDEMRKHTPNPTKAQCLTVVKDIIKQHPQSFADTLDDGQTMIGGGYASLLTQVKVRVEHVNRNNTLARHRTKNKETNPTRGPMDCYGCTRWQPEMPSGVTSESLQARKEKMMELFSREGMAGVDRAEVQADLSATYYLQRKMINSIPAPSLELLRSEWPFLFLFAPPEHLCSFWNTHWCQGSSENGGGHGRTWQGSNRFLQLEVYKRQSEGCSAWLPWHSKKHPAIVDGTLQGRDGCPLHWGRCMYELKHCI